MKVQAMFWLLMEREDDFLLLLFVTFVTSAMICCDVVCHS